uniref:dolichyl-phosphate-mannose--protein mannosyltransferase n=1 Tax=Heterorhabditis bacteriophora TaxID=37862 RepID=A0A1I7X5S7_HETBA
MPLMNYNIDLGNRPVDFTLLIYWVIEVNGIYSLGTGAVMGRRGTDVVRRCRSSRESVDGDQSDKISYLYSAIKCRSMEMSSYSSERAFSSAILARKVDTEEAYLRRREEIRRSTDHPENFDSTGKTELNYGGAAIAGAKLLIDEQRATRSMSKRLMHDCGIEEDEILYKPLAYAHGTDLQSAKEVAGLFMIFFFFKFFSLRPSNWHYELSEELLLVSLSVIPFLVSMDGQFVFDDAETVINNPVVNGKTSVFKVNYSNILYNVGLYRYYPGKNSNEKKSGEGCLGFPTAVAFAVHPIHTEAIANISGRAELLMTLFFLEALLLFINSRENVAKDAGCSVVFAILVLLSVLSKEQGIMVVPMCVMIDLSLSCRLSTLFSRRLLFLIFIFLSLVYLRLFVNDFSAPVFTQFENSAAFIANPYIRLTNYCYIWLYNLYLLLLPTSLCFDYSMGCIPLIDNFTDLRAIALPIVAIFPFIFSYIINRMDIHEARIDPTHIRSWINLLVVLDELNDCDKVLQLSVKALEAGPNNAAIHFQLGSCLGKKGQYKEAEEFLKNAIHLSPENALYHANLGVLYQRWHRFGLAAMAYRKSLAIDSSLHMIKENLIQIQTRIGNKTRIQ